MNVEVKISGYEHNFDIECRVDLFATNVGIRPHAMNWKTNPELNYEAKDRKTAMEFVKRIRRSRISDSIAEITVPNTF
jgi:hypothetical protein